MNAIEKRCPYPEDRFTKLIRVRCRECPIKDCRIWREMRIQIAIQQMSEEGRQKC